MVVIVAKKEKVKLRFSFKNNNRSKENNRAVVLDVVTRYINSELESSHSHYQEKLNDGEPEGFKVE